MLKKILIGVAGTVIGGIILYYAFGIGSSEIIQEIKINGEVERPKYASDLVSIEGLKIEQKIYSIGENATVHFIIKSYLDTQ